MAKSLEPHAATGRAYEEESRSGQEAWDLATMRVVSALDWRDGLDFGHKAWRRFDDLFEGRVYEDPDYKDDSRPKADRPNKKIVANFLQAVVRDFSAHMTKSDPEFHMKGETVEARAIQGAASSLLNTFWRFLKFKRPYKMVIQDGFKYNVGIVETGWVVKLKPDTPKTGKIAYDRYVIEDGPIMRRVHPSMFIFDPYAPDSDFQRGRWVAEIVLKPLYQIVEDVSYARDVRKRVEEGEGMRFDAFDDLSGGKFVGALPTGSKKTELEQLVVCFKYIDKRFGTSMFFAMGVDKPLWEGEDPYPYLPGFNYARLQPLLSDNHYSPSVLSLGEDQQNEIHRIRTFTYNHRRKHALRKMLVFKKMLDSSGLRKLLSGDDEVIETNMPPEIGYKFIEAPIIPPDQWRVEASAKDDLKEIMGWSETVKGGTFQSRTSAREVAAQERASLGIKMGDRQDAVDEFVLEVGEQIWLHIQHNMTRPRAVEILGEDNAEAWAVIENAQTKLPFQMRVISSAEEKFDPQVDRAQRMQIFDQMARVAPLAAQTGYEVDLLAGMLWVLQSFPQKGDLPLFFRRLSPEEMQQRAAAQAQATGAPGTPQPVTDQNSPDAQVVGAATGGLPGGG